jgi:hypothetical protein
MIDRQALIEDRLRTLTAGFGTYTDAYDACAPFGGPQLTHHRRTIALRQQAGNVSAAVADDRFVVSLRDTLTAWGIGNRASRLVDRTRFAEALRSVAPMLADLESLTIDTIQAPNEVADRLWLLIESLGVVLNQAKLVAGTKTLHHLLPNLVVPMDRAWTGSFFSLQPYEWQRPASQQQTLRRVYSHLARLARSVDPQRLVIGDGWRTSRTKVLDNALIAFCKLNLFNPPVDTDRQVSFEVAGYPPVKNEAKSLLAYGHPHAERVRTLLRAARHARDAQGFEPVADGSVELDVIVQAPQDGRTADLTNYLGGVADVLENKHARTGVEQLGDLADVWLYANDRQITTVNGRAAVADEASYAVTVRRATETRT